MERPINFCRDRRLRCGRCGHEFVVDLEWIDRWERAREQCPGCGVDCQVQDVPVVAIDAANPVLDDAYALRSFWYHTSTHSDWPVEDYAPAADFTPEMRARMGGDARVKAWAERQRKKALHVGTYEAAIHNMLRRMGDQGDRDNQFYLYRVRLRSPLTLREGSISDPSDGFGDVSFAKVCPNGEDAARYVNEHEDAGAVSLALHRTAIADVQQVAIPLQAVQGVERERRIFEMLTNAPDVPVPRIGKLARLRPMISPRVELARAIAKELADIVPINLRCQFESAVAFREGTDPARWAHRTVALGEVITQPGTVLAALNGVERRSV